jgi:Ca2+-dependent lipid-binding protein
LYFLIIWIEKPLIGGKITIKCLNAEVNRNVDKVGKMDPYVTFYIDKNKVSTKAHGNGGMKPIWNETLTIKRNSENILNFTIYDCNFNKDRLIGYGSKSVYENVYFSQKPEQKNVDVFYAGEKIGFISLEISFTLDI